MARTTPVKKAWRSLTWLRRHHRPDCSCINGAGVSVAERQSWAPKLALDLEGGTQIILAPKLESGEDASPQEQLDQAVTIIRQRIDAVRRLRGRDHHAGRHERRRLASPVTPDKTTMRPHRVVGEARVPCRAARRMPRRTDGESERVAQPERAAAPSDAPAEHQRVSGVRRRRLSPTERQRPGLGHAGAAGRSSTASTARRLDEAHDQRRPGRRAARSPSAGDGLTTAQRAAKYILGPVEVERRGHRRRDQRPGRRRSQGVSTGRGRVNIVFDAEGTKEFAKVSSVSSASRAHRATSSRSCSTARCISAPTMNARDHRRQAADHRQLHAGDVEDPRRPAEVRRPAASASRSQQSDTISATLGSTQLPVGLHRRPDRPDPRRRSTR